MKTTVLSLIFALLCASCTSVSSKRMILAGTDAEDVEYTANANTGEVHFKGKGINNSKSTGRVVGLAKYGINIWGMASVTKALAGNYYGSKNVAVKETTKQVGIKSSENVKVTDIAAGVEKAQIAADLEMAVPK